MRKLPWRRVGVVLALLMLLSFLLVQNNYAAATTAFSESSLGSIQLK